MTEIKSEWAYSHVGVSYDMTQSKWRYFGEWGGGGGGGGAVLFSLVFVLENVVDFKFNTFYG